MTPILQADDMVLAFNATTERKHWKARVSGTAALPAVNFNSRTSMVTLTYYPVNGRFAISYSKLSCAFGDFMASAYSALSQVLIALKAAGHLIEAPFDEQDGVLRLEYDPRTKQAYVCLAKLADDWLEYADASFKVPQINLDTLSIGG